MSDNTERFLGQIDGKLDALVKTMTDHAETDSKQFKAVFDELRSHAADINKAKGAKWAVLALSGAIASGVSIAVAVAAARGGF